MFHVLLSCVTVAQPKCFWPRIQSLDELISRKAAEFADQIKAAAAMADKEEEIRIEAEKQLAFIQKEAGVKLEGQARVHRRQRPR